TSSSTISPTCPGTAPARATRFRPTAVRRAAPRGSVADNGSWQGPLWRPFHAIFHLLRRGGRSFYDLAQGAGARKGPAAAVKQPFETHDSTVGCCSAVTSGSSSASSTTLGRAQDPPAGDR